MSCGARLHPSRPCTALTLEGEEVPQHCPQQQLMGPHNVAARGGLLGHLARVKVQLDALLLGSHPGARDTGCQPPGSTSAAPAVAARL